MTKTNAAGKTRRQIYEDRLRRRSMLIAGGSTLAVFLAVIILVPFFLGPLVFAGWSYVWMWGQDLVEKIRGKID